MRSGLLMARPALLLAPLLLPFVVPLALLPPAVAYVVSEARWLVVLGAVCAETSLLLASAGWNVERVRLRVPCLIGAVAPRSFAILVWTLAFVGILLLIPGYCFRGDSFGGDEPKYLRLTESLYGDLDVDVASNREARSPRGVSQPTLAPWPLQAARPSRACRATSRCPPATSGTAGTGRSRGARVALTISSLQACPSCCCPASPSSDC
jgi:hypothetical protein